MIEAVIVKVSDILTDDYGYTFIELELSDGTQGFFPNKVEVLESFYEGMEVKYREVKEFNNRPKIVGLLPNNKQKQIHMAIGQILSVDNWSYSNKNNKWFTKVSLTDDVSGIIIEENYSNTVNYKLGRYLKYQDVQTKGDVTIIVAPEPVVFDSATERDLSIKRQTAFKAAVDLFNANPQKGRWLDKDSPTGLNNESMVKDINDLTEQLFKIIA